MPQPGLQSSRPLPAPYRIPHLSQGDFFRHVQMLSLMTLIMKEKFFMVCKAQPNTKERILVYLTEEKSHTLGATEEHFKFP